MQLRRCILHLRLARIAGVRGLPRRAALPFYGREPSAPDRPRAGPPLGGGPAVGYLAILLILAPCREASPISPFSAKTKARTGLLSVWVS
jgi:hypothetical protein